jgi:hypothetical protein
VAPTRINTSCGGRRQVRFAVARSFDLLGGILDTVDVHLAFFSEQLLSFVDSPVDKNAGGLRDFLVLLIFPAGKVLRVLSLAIIAEELVEFDR